MCVGSIGMCMQSGVLNRVCVCVCVCVRNLVCQNLNTPCMHAFLFICVVCLVHGALVHMVRSA